MPDCSILRFCVRNRGRRALACCRWTSAATASRRIPAASTTAPALRRSPRACRGTPRAPRLTCGTTASATGSAASSQPPLQPWCATELLLSAHRELVCRLKSNTVHPSALLQALCQCLHPGKPRVAGPEREPYDGVGRGGAAGALMVRRAPATPQSQRLPTRRRKGNGRRSIRRRRAQGASHNGERGSTTACYKTALPSCDASSQKAVHPPSQHGHIPRCPRAAVEEPLPDGSGAGGDGLWRQGRHRVRAGDAV